MEMRQMKQIRWKGIKVIVLAFLLFAVMIPVTNVWADTTEEYDENAKIYPVMFRMFGVGNSLVEGFNYTTQTTTLGEIFGEQWIDTLEDDPQLGKFVGWTYSGELVDKDTVITLTSEWENSIYLYPKYEKQIVYVTYLYMEGKDFRSANDAMIFDESITYGQLADMIECPVNEGYEFIGWRGNGIEYDENALVTDTYVFFEAEYDKYPIRVRMTFLDENDNRKKVDEVVDLPHGTTYGDILDIYGPNNVTEWLVEGNYYEITDEIFLSRMYINATAEYEDKHIVDFYYSWITDADDTTEYGVGEVESGYIVVEKEIAKSEEKLMTELSEKFEVDINHFDQLVFDEFRIIAVDEYNAITNGRDGYIDSITVDALYEEDMINLVAYEYTDRYTDIRLFDYYYVVEQGETFYFPLEYEGEKVYWSLQEEYFTGSFQVPCTEYNTTYRFQMSTEVEDGAIIHENPSKPSEPEKPVIVEGWKKDNVGWWYQNADGTYPSNCWKMISGKWYAFNPQGYMREGWFDDGGKWYYLIPGSGQMAIGWVQVGSTWYYMNISGAMTTGWVNDGGTWYYMKSSGAMATGWVNDGGTWYYMKSSGAMATGWVKDGNTWYYMKSSGAMATGWIQDGGTWYYLNSSGAWVA